MKKKAVTAVQLTEDGKVKHMYAMYIKDFSAESLQYIFVNHISLKAKVTTDHGEATDQLQKLIRLHKSIVKKD